MNLFGNNKDGERWAIFYHPLVKKDIESLDKKTLERFKMAVSGKLSIDPVFYGSPLHGSLKKYFKLRIGDFRVVYSFSGKSVFIWLVAHRKDVYKIAINRFS